MIFDLQKYKDNVAIIDSDREYTYDDLYEAGEEILSHIPERSLVCLFTTNTYGSLAGYIAFLNHDVVPMIVDSEIEEELGATVAVERLLTVVDHDYPEFHLHMYCFITHVEEGKLELHEHSAASWLNAGSIDSVAWLPADIAVVKAIVEEGIV